METADEWETARIEVIKPFFSWQYQLDAARKMEDLSALQLHKFEQAIEQLQSHLGKDFPEYCFKNNHGVGKYFINQVPWTRDWFIWIAIAFRELESEGGFQKVKEKFMSPTSESFEEAISLLEIAMTMKAARFNIDFDKDVINEKGESKRPDIQLTNPVTGEKIFIEVTRIVPDPELEAYYNAIRGVRNIGFQHKSLLYYAGRLYKRLSDERWKEIQDQIKKSALKSAKSTSFIEIATPNVFELGIAPANNPVLPLWAAEKNFEMNSFQLPDSNTFGRIKNKIIHKSKQTAANHPTLLVVKLEEFMHHYTDPETYISTLEETLFKCPGLFAVVIIGYELGRREKKVQSFGMNYLIQKEERHLWSSRTIILFNKLHYKAPITLHSMSRLIEAFM